MVFKLRNRASLQAIPIPDGEHAVGREDYNYIHINDPSVSRRHARIINSDEGIFVEDLGSSNGTAVQGKSISGITPLVIGDIIYFGTISFSLEPELVEKLEPSSEKEKAPSNRLSLRKATEKLPVSQLSFKNKGEISSASLPQDPSEKKVTSIPAAKLSPSPTSQEKPLLASSVVSPFPAPSPSQSTPPIQVVSLNTALVLALIVGLSLGMIAGFIIAGFFLSEAF